MGRSKYGKVDNEQPPILLASRDRGTPLKFPPDPNRQPNLLHAPPSSSLYAVRVTSRPPYAIVPMTNIHCWTVPWQLHGTAMGHYGTVMGLRTSVMALSWHRDVIAIALPPPWRGHGGATKAHGSAWHVPRDAPWHRYGTPQGYTLMNCHCTFFNNGHELQ